MGDNDFYHHDWVVVRTPFYPYTTLFKDCNNTLDLDQILSVFLNDKIFLEGLYWSSPQLYQRVLEYKESPSNYKKPKKLLLSLKKYMIRSCTRSTPFGIFAGCGITNISAETEHYPQILARRVRIDMRLAFEIKNFIEALPELRQLLGYSINNTLYKVGDQYRYIECINEGGKDTYQVCSIEESKVLKAIIEHGFNSVLTLDDISKLFDDCFDKNEIDEFCFNLVDMQILVSELSFGPTADDPISHLKQVIKRLQKAKPDFADKFNALFAGIEEVLVDLNTSPLGEIPVNKIENLKNRLHELGIVNRLEHLFHVDLLKSPSEDFKLSNEEVCEIKTAITMMSKLSGSFFRSGQPLIQFKRQFVEKYGTQFVPLLTVVDPEAGIGFPSQKNIGDIYHSPFLKGINSIRQEKEEIVNLEDSTQWLFEKIDTPNIDLLLKGIDLSQQDLNGLKNSIDQLPNQFSVMGTKLLNGSVLLQSVGGSNANALLGRFAYLHETFKDFSISLAKEEKDTYPDAVLAEIAFVPEGRGGNIVRRPKLSEYEVPILCTSNGDRNTIFLSDLFVTIHDDDILLYSKSLGQRVIPRLYNAHNYKKSMIPVYKFLCAIQHQEKPALNINWGILGKKKRFLPRICYKNVILYRASWQLLPADTATIKESISPITELKRFISEWRVPQFVIVAASDNELLIDTKNDGYLDILLTQVKGGENLQLVEWPNCQEFDYKAQDQQLFVNQFILSISKRDIISPPLLNYTNIYSNTVPRIFIPGSEWLYFKIYCSAVVSDMILTLVVKPAIQLLSERGILRKAFFVRYKDPNYHIRFRILLHGRGYDTQLSSLIDQVYKSLSDYKESGLIWKIQIDTYEREIERYGENYIEASESVFSFDSLLLLDILEEESFQENDEVRFLASLKNVDSWLNLFNMSIMEKADFCQRASKSFSAEFDTNVKHWLASKYRKLKETIPMFIQGSVYDNYFKKRERQLRKIRIRKECLSAYIHMSQNRWFTTDQRLQEYIAYDLCSKYYKRFSIEDSK